MKRCPFGLPWSATWNGWTSSRCRACPSGDRWPTPRAPSPAREARVLVASPAARATLEAEGPKIDALVFSARDRNESEWAGRIAHRARLLVRTDGANGGSWSGESQGTWSALPTPGEPRDSYGCGDSFAAGFTFGLAAGMSVADAAQLGAQR